MLDLVEVLTDLVGGVLFGQLHRPGRAQEALCQGGDACGEGCGKEQGLALGRAMLGDPGDGFVKAHVEHAVRFVEHQGVQRVEGETAAFEVVHDAARRAHHDVGAVRQAVALRAHRGAATQ